MHIVSRKRVFAGSVFAIAAATAPVMGQIFFVSNNSTVATQSGSLPYEVGQANAYNGAATVELEEALGVTSASGPTLDNPFGNTITGDVSDIEGNTTVNAGTFTLGDGTNAIYLLGEVGGDSFGNGTAGSAGLTLNDNTTSSVLANTRITGGSGGSSGVAGAGAAAVSLTLGGILGNSGVITGGEGGQGTTGGVGGFGVSFAETGTLTNSGSIIAGAGGSGLGATSNGGNGGAGVGFLGGGMLINNSGDSITGGAGGSSGSNITTLTTGGAGVSFSGASGSMTNAGSITGGAGGGGGNTTGGTGAAGASFSAGGSLTNTGTITGGAGGTGEFIGGAGGAAVSFTDGGTLTNSGTLTPGIGGSGPSTNGASGVGVQFTSVAGALLNNSGGSITGGVMMGNFANNVTLQMGSTITGGLNMGTSTASTLTLTDNGSGGTENYSTAVDTTIFAGSLIKTGAGTWVMNQSMNYTGSTTIDAGTLSVGTLAVGGSNSEIGASTNASANLYLDGGTLLYTGASVSTDRGFTVDGTNGGTLNVSSSSASLQFTGAVVGGVLTKTGAGTLALGGTADNNGLGITLDAGTLILAKTSSTSPNVHAIGGSGLTINGGTVQLAGTGGDQIYDGSPVTISNGTFDLHGQSETIGTLNGTAGTITDGAGSTSSTLTVNGGGTFAGTIANGSGKLSLVDSGSSTLTLTASNTFTGGTTVNAGTLVLGDGVHQAALTATGSTYAITANNDTSLKVLANATVSGGNGISFTDGGVLNNSGSISNGGGVSFADGGTLNNSGSISGSTGVNFTGGGTLTNVGSISNGVDSTGAPVTIVNENGASISGGVTLDNYANNVTLQIGSSGGGGLNMGTSTSATLTLTDNGSGGTGTLSQAAGSTTLYGTLLKTGLGTWIVDETVSSNSATIISTGTLQLGNGTSNNGSVASNITDNAALIFANPNTQTYSGVISGSGSLTKTGAGQLTLTAAQSFTGGTTLNAGTLVLASGSNPAASLINGVQFSGAATLIDGGSVSGGVYANNYAASVTLQTGGTITSGVYLGTSSGASVTLQTGSSISGGVTLGANSAGNVTLQNGSSVSGGVTLGANSTTNVTLQIGSTITGGLNMGASTGSTLTLSDNGSGGSENYSAAVDTTTFAGQLVKSGNGTWVLDQSLSSTTSTTINSGTLQLGTGGPANISIGTGNITDNGTLVFDNPGNENITGTISGTGAVIQAAASTLTLNGPGATFTGGAVVNQGALIFATTSTPFTLAGSSSGFSGTVPLTVNDNSSVNVQASETVNGGNGNGNRGNGANGATAIILSDGNQLTNAGAINGGSGATSGNVLEYTGGTGGDGVDFNAGGTLNNSGAITGGSAGEGDYNGGEGGVGVAFIGAATLTNNLTGSITGGAGGYGGGGYGGVGSDGVTSQTANAMMTNAGSIAGGNGTHGNFTGGGGGTGVSLATGSTLINTGTITGGYASDGDTGGTGGGGVSFSGSGTLTNSGSIIARNGSGGFYIGGNGGTGVSFSAGGECINSGTITAGNGDEGDYGFGSNADSVYFTSGSATFVNEFGGSITGEVSMDNYPNTVTLQIGSSIQGLLNIGGGSASTLTLTDNGNGGTQNYSAAAQSTSFSGSLFKTGSGTWVMDQPMNYTGGTTVNAGTLKIATNGALSDTGLTINSFANVILAQGTGQASVTSLSIAANAALDITNNHLFITYAASDPITTIYGYLKSGFNGGNWNGPGIISSAAQTPTNGLRYGVGWADGKDGVVSGLSSGQIELKYTLLGDANLDGTVNGSDFSILAANFGLGVTNWDQGNFLYGSSVNGSDFSALAANFGQGDSGADAAVSPSDIAALDAFAVANNLALPTFSPVPEPGSAVVVLAALPVIFRRRKKSSARILGKHSPLK